MKWCFCELCTSCATGFDTKSGQWSLIFCFNAKNRFAVGLAEGHTVMLVIHSSRTVVSWEQPWNLNLLAGNNDIVVEGSHLLPKTLAESLFQTIFTTVVSFPFAHHDPFLAHKDEKDHAICTFLVQTTKILEILTLTKRGFGRNKLVLFTSVAIKCQ